MTDRPPPHVPFESAQEEFIRDVDRLAEVYGLDASLPELVWLKNNLSHEIRRSSVNILLRRINPHLLNHFDEHGSLIIEKDPDRRNVLRPQTVARWHVPKLDERVQIIRADSQGLALIDRDYRLLVLFEAAGIGYRPGIFGDESDASYSEDDYRLTCELIDEFTGGDVQFDLTNKQRADMIMVRRVRKKWKCTTWPSQRAR